MTNEQMCQFIAQGDSPELVPLLWEKTKKLYYHLAEKHYRRYENRAVNAGVELADCRQSCYLAFLAALDDYNREPRETLFNTFTAYHVKNAVNDLLSIRTKRGQHEPLNNAVSLDEPLQSMETDNITLLDSIEDENAQDGYADVEQNDIYRILHEAVETLPENNRAIIQACYFDNKTLNEAGEALGVSTERARQLKVKAIRLLRRKKEIMALYNDFYKPVSFSAFKHSNGSSVELAAEQREYWIKELEAMRDTLTEQGYSPDTAIKMLNRNVIVV